MCTLIKYVRFYVSGHGMYIIVINQYDLIHYYDENYLGI